MWSDIWSVAITRIGFWTWIWSTRLCRVGQEMACWFQCWKKSTGFVWSMLKWMGLLFSKNHLLRCWCWISFPNWIGTLTLFLLLKLPLGKLEPWFVLWTFFLLRLLSINLPYDHARNTAVISGLVLVVFTWNSKISYKNGYAGLLLLHLLPLLSPWLIVEM